MQPAFPAHQQLAYIPADVVELQGGDFSRSQAEAHEQEQDRKGALPTCCRAISRSDYPLDLFGGQEWRERGMLPTSDRKNCCRKVSRYHSLQEGKPHE
jgi:hypothetical protein